MSAPKPLSQPRFEALLYRRSPFTWYLFKELEWWSTEDESLLAAITLDGIDDDYAYIVLGRDETGMSADSLKPSCGWWDDFRLVSC